MLGQLVLLMVVVVGVTFVGQLRRGDAGQRGYQLVLATVAMIAVAAALGDDGFWSFVAVSLSLAVVVLPWLLDGLVRLCFGREWLAWAVRLAGLRSMLMLGAGLHRQQTILHGLFVLERRGVDDALSYFRGLVGGAEDDVELRVIHEQIVSMLLFGQRWSEGIAHYEAQFPPGYAAGRPPLALGLLRAYGEAGKLGRAAALLRAIEELLGRDPRAGSVVSQARLTFLAYAGETDRVALALTEERCRRMGLSPASGALFRGIAHLRAGHSQAAHEELSRVAGLAGARDDRVVYASRKAIARAPEPVEALPPELHTYALGVAERLEGFLAATPALRRAGSLVVTPGLLLGLGAGYVALLLLDAGGPGLLRLGAATPELVRAGSWGRLFTGLLVHDGPLALLLSGYGLWLSGPLVERLYGRGRAVLVSLGAGAAGLGAAVVLTPEPAAVLAGGALMTTGMITGALWVLLSPLTNLPRRTRRVLALPLLLLLLALAVTIPRTGTGLDVSVVGMVVAAAVGALGVALVPPRGPAAGFVGRVSGVLVAALVACAPWVAREDPQAFALAHRRPVAAQGVVLQVPERFVVVDVEREPSSRPWPLYPGLHDTLAQRLGERVQVLFTPTGDPLGPCALLRVDPKLSRALVEVEAPAPEAWREAWAAARPAEAMPRSTMLRGNGQDIGVVLERALGHGVSVVLVASPPQALVHDAALYATILAEAEAPPEH